MARIWGWLLTPVSHLKCRRGVEQAGQHLDDLPVLVVDAVDVLAPEPLAAVHRAPLQLPAKDLIR